MAIDAGDALLITATVNHCCLPVRILAHVCGSSMSEVHSSAVVAARRELRRCGVDVPADIPHYTRFAFPAAGLRCDEDWISSANDVWNCSPHDTQCMRQLIIPIALPENNHVPAECLKLPHILSVATNIRHYFFSPKFRTGLRPLEIAAFMPMPEAPMYEDDCSVPRKDNIRSTWHIAAM